MNRSFALLERLALLKLEDAERRSRLAETAGVLKALKRVRLGPTLSYRLTMAEGFAPVKLRPKVLRLAAAATRAEERQNGGRGFERVLDALFPEER